MEHKSLYSEDSFASTDDSDASALSMEHKSLYSEDSFASTDDSVVSDLPALTLPIVGSELPALASQDHPHQF